jgi:hypothetical protein
MFGGACVGVWGLFAAVNKTVLGQELLEFFFAFVCIGG